ncbi:hypothetical protein KJ912_03600, partial [Patescibacteria group bacterium]|nr:hypothetical protein [Patescibacteria group bacterium]
MTLVWLAAGCAHYTSYVRQDDGTYREKTGWLLRPMTLTDFRSFTCDKDYMVASEQEWANAQMALRGLHNFPNCIQVT